MSRLRKRAFCGRFFLIAGLFFLLFFWPAKVSGDGIILPYPPPGFVVPPRFYLKIVSHDVKAEIRENIAQVEIEEEFKNPHKFPVEGDFLFPLPVGASISKFSLFVGEEEIEGEVLSRDEARRIYERIVRRRRDPALLEYYNQTLFRARVFPIPPKGTRKVTLRYEEVLDRVGRAYRWRYPLKIEGLSTGPIDRVTIEVRLKTDEPIRSAYSPTHSLELIAKGSSELIGVYEDTRVTPISDFLFYFVPTRDSVASIFLPYREEGEDGYFLLTISPGYFRGEKELPKDIVFTLDVSGSMKGKKIEDAKKALLFFLDALNTKDRFGLVTFSGDVNTFSNDWSLVNEDTRERAKKFVHSLIAEGGTNFYGALRRSLSFPEDPDRPLFIILLTDGAPTVGPTDPDTIIRRTEKVLKGQRIFVFGVGVNVNTHLLDRLARLANGSSMYVRREENLEEILSSFYNRIAFPALSNLQVTVQGVDVFDLYPSQFNNLFYGEDLVIAGRFLGEGKAQLKVQGLREKRRISFSSTLDFPVSDKRFPFVGRIWALRRVADLLDMIRMKGEKEEWIEEIERLGKKFGIVTPYTSYLVREAPEKAPLALERTEIRAQVGKKAFRAAQALSRMRETGRVFLREESELPVRHLAQKAFFLKDSVWTDTEYKEGMPTEKILFASGRYFELLREHPDFASFMSLGERVIFVYQGKAYWIERS